MSSPRLVCRHCLKAIPVRRHPPRIVRAGRRCASTGPPAHAPPSLPAVLLKRARLMAAEHATLSTTLQNEFDVKVAKRVGELGRVATALKEWEEAHSSLAELESMRRSSDKELRQLATDELGSTLETISSLSTALSLSLTPRDPYADMPCLLEVRPGPGGSEGRYFADTIFRMYRQYCARMGLRTNTVQYETVDDGETAGGEAKLAEAVLEIVDAGSYGMFKGEAGMHRVQRVPATESSGRTHTSAVAVWVLPSFPESSSADQDVNDPASDFYIDPKDVRAEKMRAGGAGGQHVNKTESAVRLTHIPTGVVVSMQDSRSQHQNRDKAWQLLRSRVAQIRREEKEEIASSIRNSILSKDKTTRGDKIRTYNYHQDRCTDHRSGLDVHNLPDVLQGGEMLSKLMASAKDYLIGRDIKALIAEEEGREIGDEKKRGKR